jgi:hydrogenase-4 membrane subunit HyfE
VEMAETRGWRRAIAFYLVAVSVWAVIVYVFLVPYFRALTNQMEGSIEHVWWAFGAVGTAAGIFVVVGMLRDQSLGPMQPKALRNDGLVMLAVTAAFALVCIRSRF